MEVSIFQESLLIVKGQRNRNKARKIADLSDLKVDRDQDKFPGCISLVSIGYETDCHPSLRMCKAVKVSF